MAGVYALILAEGCHLPGKPKPGAEVPRPEEVLAFDKLYGDNCAGCHGTDGKNGSATDLANPEYEQWVDDASLRDVIANGEKGTLMPAFAVESGGTLTDAQINALLSGMRAQWRKGSAFGNDAPPPYKSTNAGDAQKGKSVYAVACARCHGATARQPGPAGSILDGTFLALIDEQTVRTTIVAGRPDIGEPDWRGHIPGRAMTADEVTDVSAWLMSQKPVLPGQPYPSTNPAAETPGDGQRPAVKR